VEEVIIAAISAFTLAAFGAGGIGVWVKKRNNGNGNVGGSKQIQLLTSINDTLIRMDANIDRLGIELAEMKGRLSN